MPVTRPRISRGFRVRVDPLVVSPFFFPGLLRPFDLAQSGKPGTNRPITKESRFTFACVVKTNAISEYDIHSLCGHSKNRLRRSRGSPNKVRSSSEIFLFLDSDKKFPTHSSPFLAGFDSSTMSLQFSSTSQGRPNRDIESDHGTTDASLAAATKGRSIEETSKSAQKSVGDKSESQDTLVAVSKQPQGHSKYCAPGGESLVFATFTGRSTDNIAWVSLDKQPTSQLGSHKTSTASIASAVQVNFRLIDGASSEFRQCYQCTQYFIDQTNMRQADGSPPCSFHTGTH